MTSSTSQNRVTLLWDIENFDLIDYSGKTKLISPVFTVTELENSQWVIELQPQDDEFLISVRKSKSDTSPLIVLSCAISISPVTAFSTYNDISFDSNKTVTASLSLTNIKEYKALFFYQNVFTIKFDMWGELAKIPKVYCLKNEIEIAMRKTVWQIAVSGNSLYGPEIQGFHESTLRIECTYNKNTGMRQFLLRASSIIVECKVYAITNYQSITHPVAILLHPSNDFTKLFHNTSYQLGNTASQTFICVFRISRETFASHAQNEEDKINFAPSSPNNGYLNDGIIGLYTDQRLCDFSLITQDEKVFKIHSPILASRSPVFLAMFESNMSEKITKTVLISDVESGILQLLLHFVYVNELACHQFDTVVKLYIASEKYQIVTLKSKCSAFLISLMSLEHVCEILILSDTYQDPEMKKSAFEFIYCNKSKVFVSDAWKDVVENHFELATDCIFYMSEELAKE